MHWIGDSTDGERLAEFAGRLCYMSQHNPANRSTRDYLENIKKQGHGSVLEHANYSLLLEGVSRSLTHELVRHRAGFAYSQLSQRYVDESEASFVVPPAIVGDEALEGAWRSQIESAQSTYVALVAQLMERYGWVADKVHRRKMAREAARGVLPNSTETKIVVTGNARAWRTMLELRSSEGAELEIRRLAVAVLRVLQEEAPAFFSDFEIYAGRGSSRGGAHLVPQSLSASRGENFFSPTQFSHCAKKLASLSSPHFARWRATCPPARKQKCAAPAHGGIPQSGTG